MQIPGLMVCCTLGLLSMPRAFGRCRGVELFDGEVGGDRCIHSESWINRFYVVLLLLFLWF